MDDNYINCAYFLFYTTDFIAYIVVYSHLMVVLIDLSHKF